MSGVEMIAAERSRQIEVEGWDEKHDDQHALAEIGAAAFCYLENALQILSPTVFRGFSSRTVPPIRWPWSLKWWKPTDDQVRNLVKAGALIAAEIDRLQRKAAKR